jgi:hypothetical protein
MTRLKIEGYATFACFLPKDYFAATMLPSIGTRNYVYKNYLMHGHGIATEINNSNAKMA